MLQGSQLLTLNTLYLSSFFVSLVVHFSAHLRVQQVQPAVGHCCYCTVALLQGLTLQELLKYL